MSIDNHINIFFSFLTVFFYSAHSKSPKITNITEKTNIWILIYRNCSIFSLYTGTSIQRRTKGLVKYVCYNEVSLFRGSFPCIALLLGPVKSFVIPRTSVYRGSLNRSSTVSSGAPLKNPLAAHYDFQRRPGTQKSWGLSRHCVCETYLNVIFFKTPKRLLGLTRLAGQNLINRFLSEMGPEIYLGSLLFNRLTVFYG